MREDEYYQMQLERQRMLEEALERAKQGAASEDDWSIIHFECGVPRPTLQPLGIN